MDNKNPAGNTYDNTSRKIRTRSSRSLRTNPYKRSTARDQNQNVKSHHNEDQQGLLGRVTNIIPSWISGWWSQDRRSDKEKNERHLALSEETGSGDDEEISAPLSNIPDLNHQGSNHMENSTQGEQKSNFDVSPLERYSGNTEDSISLQSSQSYSTNVKSGFYQRYRTAENTETLIRPSFANDTTNEESDIFVETDRNRKYSYNESESAGGSSQGPSSLNLPQSKFNTLRTHGHSNIISKPAFKISAFMQPSHQQTTTFNMSLNSSSFDFTTGNRSPFYTGCTIFGGSSSFRECSAKRQKVSPVSNRVRTTRTQVRAKLLPTAKRNTVTSDTAKRILSTLDRMSSPLKDSRKLPSVAYTIQSPSLSRQLRQTARNEVAQSKPPAQKLDTEQSLNMSRTFAAKKLTHFTGRNATATFQPQALPASLSTEKQSTTRGKNSLKMKRDRNTAHYSSNNNEEEIVNTIPEVSRAVPLVITSLPKFKFVFASNTAPTFTPIAKPLKEGSNVGIASTNSARFNFAPPGVMSDKALLSSTPDTKKFAFSTPMAVESKEDSSSKETVIPNNTSSFKIFNPPGVSGKKLNEKTASKEENISVKTKSSEVEENKKKIIASMFSKPKDSWECPTCMIQNNLNSLKCIACSEPNPTNNNETPGSEKEIGILGIPAKTNEKTSEKIMSSVLKYKFGNLSENTWECPTCMIRNKEDCLRCIACTEPKPACTQKPTISSNIASTESKSSTEIMKNVNWGLLKSMFQQQDENNWECPTCMVNNKEESLKCAACEAPKPGSKPRLLKSMFGQQDENEWECPTCMIKNKEVMLECAACKTPKPGSNPDLTPPQFSFGQSSYAAGSSGFTFGISSNNNTNPAPFGSSNASEFTFEKKTDEVEKKVIFGHPSTENTSSENTSSGFSNKKVSNDKDDSFKLGGDNVMQSTFHFGNTNTANTTSDSSLSKAGIGFQVPVSKDVKLSGSELSFGAKQSQCKEVSDIAKPAFPSIAVAAKAGFLSVPGVENVGKIMDTIMNKSPPKTENQNKALFGASVNTSFLFGKSSTQPTAGFSFGNTSSQLPISKSVFGSTANPLFTLADTKTSNTSSFKIGASHTKSFSSPSRKSESISTTEVSSFSFRSKQDEKPSVSFTNPLLNTDKTDMFSVSNNSTSATTEINVINTNSSNTFTASTFWSANPPSVSSFNFGSQNTNTTEPSTLNSSRCIASASTSIFRNTNPSDLNLPTNSGTNNQSSSIPTFNIGSENNSAMSTLFGSTNTATTPSSSSIATALTTSSNYNFTASNGIPSFNFGSGSVSPFASQEPQSNNSGFNFRLKSQVKSGFDFTGNNKTVPFTFSGADGSVTFTNKGNDTTKPNLFSMGTNDTQSAAGGGVTRRTIKRAARRIKK